MEEDWTWTPHSGTGVLSSLSPEPVDGARRPIGFLWPSLAPQENHAKEAKAEEEERSEKPLVVPATAQPAGDGRADEDGDHEERRLDLGAHGERESITLASVYEVPEAEGVLYELLREREGREDVNISHRRMPTLEEHQAFVRSAPYLAWYLIGPGPQWRGSIYLSSNREVGVFVFARHQGRGVARAAVEELRREWPGRLLANVNPLNERSRRLFERLGFRLLQVTYAIE